MSYLLVVLCKLLYILLFCPGVRSRGPSLKMGSVFFFGGAGGWGGVGWGVGRAFEIAQYSPYYVTLLYTQNGRRFPGLVCINKRHQAVQSLSRTFTCAPFFYVLKLWENVCFYGVDSSGKEAGD